MTPAHDYPAPQEFEEHRRAFIGFERLVLFAVLHITLTLGCLAVGLFGDAPLLSLLVWIAGSLAMVAYFVIRGSDSPAPSGD